jgi:hypothetical protein
MATETVSTETAVEAVEQVRTDVSRGAIVAGVIVLVGVGIGAVAHKKIGAYLKNRKSKTVVAGEIEDEANA